MVTLLVKDLVDLCLVNELGSMLVKELVELLVTESAKDLVDLCLVNELGLTLVMELEQSLDWWLGYV
jgi:hypothetical protein